MKLIPGVTVEMGGREFVVPPLSADSLIRLIEDGTYVAVAGQKPVDETNIADMMTRLRQLAHFIHEALVRNYPELTEADVLKLMDMNATPKVVMAILGITVPERHREPAGEQEPHHS